MISKRLVIPVILGAGLLLGFLWLINIPLATAQATANVNGIFVTKDHKIGFENAAIHSGPVVTPTGKTGKDPSESSDSPKRFPINKSYAPLADRTTSTGGIANGDFENGPDGSWTEFSSHGWSIIVSSTVLPGAVLPHSGDWAVWLGGANDETSYIMQNVVVSAESPALTYWNWIASADSCGYDWAQVAVNGNIVSSYTLCGDTNTGGWAKRSVDLRAYAGQTVQLQFEVITDSSYNSNLFIDDVALEKTFDVFLPLCTRNFCAGPTFADDFSNPNSGWDSGDSANTTYGYLGGEYQILKKVPNQGFLDTPNLSLPANYQLEVDARQVSANAGSFGLSFAIQWSGNSFAGMYQFLLRSDSQEYLFEKYNGTWQTVIDWTYSSWINSGTSSNHLTVQRVGTSILLAVNGHTLTTLSDGDLMGAGRDAGLRVYSYDSAPVDVRFDNFRLACP